MAGCNFIGSYFFLPQNFLGVTHFWNTGLLWRCIMEKSPISPLSGTLLLALDMIYFCYVDAWVFTFFNLMFQNLNRICLTYFVLNCIFWIIYVISYFSIKVFLHFKEIFLVYIFACVFCFIFIYSNSRTSFVFMLDYFLSCLHIYFLLT